MYFDDVFKSIGQFGTYQKKVYLMQCLPFTVCALQTSLSVFILFLPDHRCYLPGYHNDTFNVQNDYHEFLINRSIPFVHTEDGHGRSYSQCQLYNNEFKYNSGYEDETDHNTTRHFRDYHHLNSTVLKYGCKKWVYDKTEFDSTFATQDNLVCRKKSLRVHALMSFMAGFTFGSLIIGVFSDMAGRKKAILASVLLILIPNITVTFISNFVVFVILRFLSGISVGGLIGVCFVMGFEFVGPSKRTLVGIVIELFWALGTLILALLAYLIRDWKHLNLVVSIPPVLFLSYIWIMPESIRWLLIKGRKEEALKIIRHIAKVNGTEFPEKLIKEASFDTERCTPLWKLCSTPAISLKTSIVFFNWVMCSVLFYGLNFNVRNISGNIFFNFFLVSLAEWVGFSGCLLFLNKGRKPVYITASVIAGSCCIGTVFPMMYGSSDLQWMTVSLAMIGKVFTSASFATILLFTAELYPTYIRSSAIGAAGFFSRIGGMVAPYIVDLAQTVPGKLGQSLPMIIFGLTAMLAGLLALNLQETANKPLLETLQDYNREKTTRIDKCDIDQTKDEHEMIKLYPEESIEV